MKSRETGSGTMPTVATSSRPAGPRTARLINDRVAYDLLLANGPMTRPALRELTGLSRPTVGDLVRRLERQGLIQAVGESGAERRGPNAVLFDVVPSYAYAAGVEVRADMVHAVVTDVRGHPVGSALLANDPTEAPDLLVSNAVRAAQRDAGVPKRALRAVVVATPGLVDPGTGDLSYAASMPSWHRNLLPGLKKRLGVPIVLENEVNLAGRAEHRLGVARGRRTFAFLWLDTGVGLAVIIDGRLHRGVSGGAGEVAYLPVDGAGALDNWRLGPPRLGTPRNLQDLVGGRAVPRLARRYEVRPNKDLERLVASGGPDFLDALADRIALGAAGICAVVDPGCLVLSGAIGRGGGPRLSDRVEVRVRRMVPLPTEVLAGVVGEEDGGSAALRGAILTALDMVRDEAFASDPASAGDTD